MLISIDASRANREPKTGTEWYSYYVIQELKKIIPQEHQVVLYTNEALKGDLALMPANWSEHRLKWPPKYLWTQLRLWWELILQKPDVLLVPAHTIPFLPVPKKVKMYVTVHDVGFKRFPKLYKPIQVWYHDLTMRRIKGRADKILTISEFSRQEIMDCYQIKSDRIKVGYLGYDQQKFQPHQVDPAILTRYKISQPYILYLGRLEKKKNIGNIVKAFASVKAEHPDLQLVLAGSGGNMYDEVKDIIRQYKLETEIILTGYLAEEDLPQVLAGAKIFVFPTLYEGFGLPIIQAMAAGVPVITSDMEPHREVAGGAACLVNPQQSADLATAISRLLSEPAYTQALMDKGMTRARYFSWSQTAQVIWSTVDQESAF